MRHHATPKFWECYRQLPENIRRLADDSCKLLRRNPKHPSLHFKTVGGFWSVRAFQAVSMDRLAVELGPAWGRTSRHVVNRTGLTGNFDFTLDYTKYVPLDPARGHLQRDMSDGDRDSAMIRAVREQLGLTLRPTHALLDVWVVDHVEKMPTGN